MTSMFASVTLSPPENLNIPPIQIPTESDDTAHSAASANPRLIPLLGTPPPQRRQQSFGFPSLAASASASVTAFASASASASATASIESAASILLSMAHPESASPLTRPSKCRRITATFLDYCRVCEISLLNVAHGIYADVCKSCEDIQHRFRKGTSFPACFICYSDAYHIHRNCNQAICKRCLRQHTLCPSCKVPIDKQ
jgi:hypothetical protein